MSILEFTEEYLKYLLNYRIFGLNLQHVLPDQKTEFHLDHIVQKIRLSFKKLVESIDNEHFDVLEPINEFQQDIQNVVFNQELPWESNVQSQDTTETVVQKHDTQDKTKDKTKDKNQTKEKILARVCSVCNNDPRRCHWQCNCGETCHRECFPEHLFKCHQITTQQYDTYISLKQIDSKLFTDKEMRIYSIRYENTQEVEILLNRILEIKNGSRNTKSKFNKEALYKEQQKQNESLSSQIQEQTPSHPSTNPSSAPTTSSHSQQFETIPEQIRVPSIEQQLQYHQSLQSQPNMFDKVRKIINAVKEKDQGDE